MNLDIPFIGVALQAMVKVIPLTILMTILPIIFGLLIAIVISFVQIRHIKFMEPLSHFYTSFFRSTPAILHIMLIYLGLPALIKLVADLMHMSVDPNEIPVVVFVVMALSLTAGAYLTEIIRSGIISVDHGQIEAAYSTGMTHKEVFQRILLPQAIDIAFPNFTNLLIGFLHTTSIASIIAVPEITGTANIVAADNYSFLEAFIAAGIIYWILSLIIEYIQSIAEKRRSVYKEEF